MNIFEFKAKKEEQKLKLLYNNSILCKWLWNYDLEYSKILGYAVKKVIEKKDERLALMSISFIRYTAIQFIITPRDLITCIESVKKSKEKKIFLEYLSKENLIDDIVQSSLFFNEDLFYKLPVPYLSEWLRGPLSKYFKILLDSNKEKISLKDIFPYGMNVIDEDIIEWILGWGYEEGQRLDNEAENYLADKFPDKYDQLNKLNK